MNTNPYTEAHEEEAAARHLMLVMGWSSLAYARKRLRFIRETVYGTDPQASKPTCATS